jgi:hypothetical protein
MLEFPDYFYPEIRESLAQNRGALIKNVEEIDQKSWPHQSEKRPSKRRPESIPIADHPCTKFLKDKDLHIMVIAEVPLLAI